MLTTLRRWMPPALLLAVAMMTNVGRTAEPKVLVEGMDNPVGVAVQPKTGDVFVSTNKAIHRLTKSNGYEAAVFIDGFATDVYGKGPMYNIGPLGLLFTSPMMLAVGGGDQLDGAEVVRFFNVAVKKAGLTVDDAAAVSGPIKPGAESAKGEGNYYALAKIGSDVFVTCNGDDTKGWIAKITIADGKPGDLVPFIATKEKVSVDAPCGIAVSKEGELVVSQMGEITVPGDSLLNFYDPKSGELKKSLKTNLSDIISIAYSPKTGKLYGVDFSWSDVSKGALYELAIDGDEVKATKVVDLLKPTALAIDDDGNAFVTVIGSTDAGGGKVLMFKGM